MGAIKLVFAVLTIFAIIIPACNGLCFPAECIKDRALGLAQNMVCYSAAKKMGALIDDAVPKVPDIPEGYKETLTAASCLVAAVLLKQEQAVIQQGLKLAGVPPARVIFRKFARLTSKGNKNAENWAELVGSVVDRSPAHIIRSTAKVVGRQDSVNKAIDKLVLEANIKKPMTFANNAAKIFCELGHGVIEKVLHKRPREETESRPECGVDEDLMPSKPKKRLKFSHTREFNHSAIVITTDPTDQTDPSLTSETN